MNSTNLALAVAGAFFWVAASAVAAETRLGLTDFSARCPLWKVRFKYSWKNPDSSG